VIGIEDAPRGYAKFDQGASRKYVLNPHGALDGARPV
jgi:glutathione-independent formaldehyde dehydrogenase